jgi:hypothetical protein
MNSIEGGSHDWCAVSAGRLRAGGLACIAWAASAAAASVSFTVPLEPFKRVMRIYDAYMAIPALAEAHPRKQPDSEGH